MTPLVAASLVGAGSSILGGLLGSISNSSTNAANMKLAKYQYEKNLEMWNLQNEYNSPVKQMERLKEAGLNPNLVYGNGSVVGNTTSDAPSYNPPTLSSYQGWSGALDNAVRSVKTAHEMQLMQTQNDNAVAQTGLINSQIKNTDAMATLNYAKALSEMWRQEAIPYEIKLKQNDALLRQFQAEREGNYALWSGEVARLEYDNLAVQRQLNVQRIGLTYAQTVESQARRKGIDAQTAKTIAETSLIPLNKLLLNRQIKLSDNQIEKLENEVANLSLDAVLKRKTGRRIDAETIHQQLKNGQLRQYGTENPYSNAYQSIWSFANDLTNFLNSLFD